MMAKIVTIQPGESLPFSFDRGGNSISGWTCVMTVKQYPGGPVMIQRTITPNSKNKWAGFLTQTETSGLTKGLYYMEAKLTNSTTDEEEAIVNGNTRFHVSPAWT